MYKRIIALGGIAATAVAVLSAGSAVAAPAAQAGVTDAALTCYIDTYALDVPTTGRCSAIWRPGAANNPTIAWFGVSGLPSGSYRYVWTDLETGLAPNPACANGPACNQPIATDVSGDGLAYLSVKITDNATGASKTVSARAKYLDGWT